MFLFLDVGSNNSGYYELQAVLTHKGRSSSSGHYVAWVRRKGGECHSRWLSVTYKALNEVVTVLIPNFYQFLSKF